MLFKIIFAITTGLVGYILWRQASEWKRTGLIPSGYNDGFGAAKRPKGRNLSFDAVIIFQKCLSGMAWLFCLMCIVSLIFGWGDQ